MFVLIAAVLWMCASAYAQSPSDFAAMDASLKACGTLHSDIPGSSGCELSAFNSADKRLNQVYSGVVAGLKKPGADEAAVGVEIVKRLTVAERAWVAFRDAQCNYMSTVALNAPLEGYEYQACRYALTKERIRMLTSPEAPQNAR